LGLFGTDGVRGLANADLSPELALSVASAAARVLSAHDETHRPVAVVGRDPRASGEMLEAAVVAGLTSTGADVVLAGAYGADIGVVLSASHNPMEDNGIKLFARGGQKLPDHIEAEIEAVQASGPAWSRPIGSDIGRVRVASDGAKRYLEHLAGAVTTSLSGLHVVVDCSHGAASFVAPEFYRRCGARVTALAASPDGLNINLGVGSTHPALLATAVTGAGADLGIAHDGDADRCLAVDSSGELVDGDQILALCAIGMREAGTLRKDTVVATVMSNLGFHHAMRAAGIEVVTTGVGDRNILEVLRAQGLSLGGEPSGHVVFPSAATTGDGLLTALHVMARMVATGRPLAELASVVQRLPQVLVNVHVDDRARVASSRSVQAAVTEAATQLGDNGRILLRPSGTEQLVRVMVEAPTQQQADSIALRLSDVVASA